MSKKRRRQNSVQSPSTPLTSTPMRERESFARDLKSLRSVEAMKLRQNLVQVFNDETVQVFNDETQAQLQRNRIGRPATGRSVPAAQPRRNLPRLDEMSRQRMPTKVRDELLDGVRLLSCYRRNARKETLFALRRIGKGKSGRGIRKAKWTDKSYLRCK